jgi:hypothetical protein
MYTWQQQQQQQLGCTGTAKLFYQYDGSLKVLIFQRMCMLVFCMPLAVVLGMENYVKPLQLQHKTVPAAHLFCSLVTTVYPVQLLPFCNKTDTFYCRSSNSPGLCQDVFILSRRFSIFFQHNLLCCNYIHTHRLQTRRETDRQVHTDMNVCNSKFWY